MNMNPAINRHATYRLSVCAYALCTGVDIKSMEGDGAQIVPVSPEISTAYLCKECFTDLPVSDIITITRSYLSSEKGLMRKRLWEWKRGIIAHDPCEHLEASILFLRGATTEPPFSSPTFLLHGLALLGHPRIIYRKHLALIPFD